MLRGALLAASFLTTTVAQAGYYFPAQDISWQNQFAGAVHWSALPTPVKDDSGATDNTAALNALPTNTPIIADCPHGGFVQFTGTWNWPSGLTVWQQPGCVLDSTITTPGVWPIQSTGGATNLTPISNVQYYGMQFSFVTPTSGVRVLLAYINHFKFKYFDINGSGGFTFLRGSDQEVAYGTMENTITLAGNPGIRHIANLPKVPSSPGMKANVWFHNLNFQTGDAAFQACQPISNNPSVWYDGLGTGTDDLLYENNYGNSGSSFLILANLDQNYGGSWHYNCDNVTFRNINGNGTYYALLLAGGPDGGTHNLTVDTGTFNKTTAVNTGNATFGIGDIFAGGITYTGSDMANVTVKNVTSNGTTVALAITGAFPSVSVSNSAFNGPTSSVFSPLIQLSGTSGVVFKNVSARAYLGDTLEMMGSSNVGFAWNGGTISGVRNATNGVNLGTSSGASITGLTITPYAGATTATGVYLATDPNGTNSATVTGNDVSAMPVPIVCAPGQGNNVTNNTGAADCAP